MTTEAATTKREVTAVSNGNGPATAESPSSAVRRVRAILGSEERIRGLIGEARAMKATRVICELGVDDVWTAAAGNKDDEMIGVARGDGLEAALGGLVAALRSQKR